MNIIIKKSLLISIFLSPLVSNCFAYDLNRDLNFDLNLSDEEIIEKIEEEKNHCLMLATLELVMVEECEFDYEKKMDSYKKMK